MALDIVEEIFQEINKQNAVVGMRAIPHSDDFIKYVTSSLGVDADFVRRALGVLLSSHRIFSMEIVAEDGAKDVPRVEGYVVTNITIVRRLKNYFQSELMVEYERQFHKRHLFRQIVKEIFPMMRSLNNTIVGQLANKAIMLDEFERLLEKNFGEFTDEWKEQHFASEMQNANFPASLEKSRGPAATPGTGSTRSGKVKPVSRAIDTKQYEDFVSKSNSYPLQRILKIYGVNFFLQVNLRKYQFEYLKKLVEDGQLNRRSDLLLLRGLIQMVKSNMHRDSGIAPHLNELYDLEKSVTHRLFFAARPS
ncbi:MAG TPA: hypothetical protein VLM75_13115 [Spirochaetota bacterium]|nr:hypothetical protein [Spirochaetota bacterium]